MDDTEVQRKFKLNGVYCQVTWSRSTIGDHMEFYAKLKGLLPRGAEVYGAKESHVDGTWSYNVVIKFHRKVHWTDARRNFMMIGDTEAITIRVPEQRQSIREFLENTQSYCTKGNTLGAYVNPNSAAAVERKRKDYEDDDDDDDDSSKMKLRQAKLFVCVNCHDIFIESIRASKDERRYR
jgi:hypothetical protein